MSSRDIRKVTILLKMQSCSTNKAEGKWWRKGMHFIKVYLHISHLAFQISPTGIIHFTSDANVQLSEKGKSRESPKQIDIKKDRAVVPLAFSVGLSYSLKILAFSFLQVVAARFSFFFFFTKITQNLNSLKKVKFSLVNSDPEIWEGEILYW